MAFVYPLYPIVIVGMRPDKIKQLSPLDVRALVAAFKELTGVDPLVEGVQAYRVYDEGKWRKPPLYRVHDDGRAELVEPGKSARLYPSD